ncbi:MAG: porphobilinogen synthase [Cloacibacillus evryensis]
MIVRPRRLKKQNHRDMAAETRLPLHARLSGIHPRERTSSKRSRDAGTEALQPDTFPRILEVRRASVNSGSSSASSIRTNGSGPTTKTASSSGRCAPAKNTSRDVLHRRRSSAYTSHGHCGLLKGETVDNDPTLELLAQTALSQAQAGADIVAPSDMMDGHVAAIRAKLDGAGMDDTLIFSYAVKYASAFYGPFREAAGSAPSFGDRKSYQMDPRNVREGIREALLDIEEGADMIMVKPGLPYLDVLRAVKEVSEVPVGAYCVSGEYSMIKAAAERGWLDEKRVIAESAVCLARGGADIIVSYFAPELAKMMKEGEL